MTPNTMLQHWLDPTVCQQVGTALLHFLWQATALGGIVMAVQTGLRQRSSQLRYALSLGLLVIMAVCLPINLALIRLHTNDPVQTEIVRDGLSMDASATAVLSEKQVRQQHLPVSTNANLSTELLTRTIPVSISHPGRDVTIAPEVAATHSWADVANWAVAAWILGAVIMLLRLSVAQCAGWRLAGMTFPVTESVLLRAAEAQTKRIALAVQPAMAWCERVSVPMVVGLTVLVLLQFLEFELPCQSAALHSVSIVFHDITGAGDRDLQSRSSQIECFGSRCGTWRVHGVRLDDVGVARRLNNASEVQQSILRGQRDLLKGASVRGGIFPGRHAARQLPARRSSGDGRHGVASVGADADVVQGRYIGEGQINFVDLGHKFVLFAILSGVLHFRLNIVERGQADAIRQIGAQPIGRRFAGQPTQAELQERDRHVDRSRSIRVQLDGLFHLDAAAAQHGDKQQHHVAVDRHDSSPQGMELSGSSGT